MNPRIGLAEFRSASQRVITAKGQSTLKSRERALRASDEPPVPLVAAHPRFMANTLSNVHRAVIEGQFVLAYQPCVDIRTGEISHLEALLRWPLSPPDLSINDLVATLERNGLILHVGAWVVRQACADLSRFRAAGHRDLTLSINVSGSQVFDPGLPDLIGRSLRSGQIPPSRLMVEITETMVPDLLRARDLVNSLGKLGVQTVIDDFGVGFSSMSLLKDLPAAGAIKLDRSFVHGLGTDRRGSIVAESIVQLASRLGLRVIAEGVETQTQVRWLRKHGVHLSQGFIYSAAVSFEDVLSMLELQPFKQKRTPRPPARATL